MPLFLRDTRIFLLVTIMSIAVIQIDIFGVLGLIVYGLLIAYGVVFIAVNFKNLHLLKHPVFYIACAYYLYFILANLINGSFNLRGPSIVQYLLLCVVAFSVRPVDKISRDITSAAKFMTVIGIVQAVFCIFAASLLYFAPQFVDNTPEFFSALIHEVADGFPVRASGLVQNANLTAGYEFVSGILSFFLLLNYAKNKKWIWPAIINIALAIYIVFVYCASRTYMLAGICFILAFLLLYYLGVCRVNEEKRKIFHICLICICVVFVIAIIILICAPSVRDFLLNRVLRVDSLSTGSGRLNIWKTSIELGKGHRLFGISYEALEEATGYGNAHNSILEMLTFGGLPTLILFSIYYLYTIYVAAKVVLKSKIDTQTMLFFCFLVAYIIGHFVAGMTESDINRLKMTTVLFSISMGFIHVINYQLKKQEQLN